MRVVHGPAASDLGLVEVWLRQQSRVDDLVAGERVGFHEGDLIAVINGSFDDKFTCAVRTFSVDLLNLRVNLEAREYQFSLSTIEFLVARPRSGDSL